MLLKVNYSQVHHTYELQYDYPMVPEESASAIFDWAISNRIHWNINTYWQSSSSRVSIDERNDLPGYAVFNTSWNLQINGKLQTHFSIFNLANNAYSYPASVNTYRDDYPAALRSFSAGFNYKFY